MFVDFGEEMGGIFDFYIYREIVKVFVYVKILFIGLYFFLILV